MAPRSVAPRNGIDREGRRARATDGPTPQVSVDFEPVTLGRPRRRIDPLVVGLVLTVAAVIVAVVKPWGVPGPATAGPEIAASPAPTQQASVPEPDESPRAAGFDPVTWANVASVVSRREAWGIRAIAFDASDAASDRVPGRYAEHWATVDGGGSARDVAVVDAGDDAVVALGVTFPQAETPLGVRIWRDHGDGDLEWIDARPLNEVPGRGAYLFGLEDRHGRLFRSWEAGRYRVDILVGPDIRRMSVEILNRFGALPPAEPWVELIPAGPELPRGGPLGLPVGPFAWRDDAAIPLLAAPGPMLDEAAAWLDVDRQPIEGRSRSFTARAYQSSAAWLGVVLPAWADVHSADLLRLAPSRSGPEVGGTSMTVSGEELSFVAFARPGGAAWRPGVYALRVEFIDADGTHDLTWHVELRPGGLQPEPVLLSATRAWARFAGTGGVLLGTTEALDGVSTPSSLRLLDIGLESDGPYGGLTGPNLLGCGETIVRGRPTVIGFVGPAASGPTSISATILFPFAYDGPLPVLTAAGAVPGLAIAAPVLTAEFGGPASYGFRAGSAQDAPGYTICIGFPASAGG